MGLLAISLGEMSILLAICILFGGEMSIGAFAQERKFRDHFLSSQDVDQIREGDIRVGARRMAVMILPLNLYFAKKKMGIGEERDRVMG